MVDLTQNKKWTPAPSDSFVPPSLPLAHHKGILWGKTAIIIAWLAMLLFALHASTHMVGAGDTWVALACPRVSAYLASSRGSILIFCVFAK
jgi:hypothetical protein